jgi:hypothetical protein
MGFSWANNRAETAGAGTPARLVFTLDAQYKDAEADAITRECLAAWRKPDYSFHTGDLIPRMSGSSSATAIRRDAFMTGPAEE